MEEGNKALTAHMRAIASQECCDTEEHDYLIAGSIVIDEQYRHIEELKRKLELIEQVTDFPARTNECSNLNSSIWSILNGDKNGK